MIRLGQNFLKPDRSGQAIVKKMIEAAEVSDKDVVLEAGPGRGILTEALLEKAGRVIAVEKDKGLADYLKKKFASRDNLEVIEGDILKIQKSPNQKLRFGTGQAKFKSLKNYKVVANIPYYITSRFLRVFLQDVKYQPEKMVLMVQKEVGERIVVSPRPNGRGKSRPHPACKRRDKMNLLAISVQVFGKPKIIANVSKERFSPRPKVDSVILEISNISRNFFKSPNTECLDFFKIVRTGFAAKRKFLMNNLKKIAPKEALDSAFAKCPIPEKSRAENLSLENWKCLTKNLSTQGKSRKNQIKML